MFGVHSSSINFTVKHFMYQCTIAAPKYHPLPKLYPNRHRNSSLRGVIEDLITPASMAHNWGSIELTNWLFILALTYRSWLIVVSHYQTTAVMHFSVHVKQIVFPPQWAHIRRYNLMKHLRRVQTQRSSQLLRAIVILRLFAPTTMKKPPHAKSAVYLLLNSTWSLRTEKYISPSRSVLISRKVQHPWNIGSDTGLCKQASTP